VYGDLDLLADLEAFVAQVAPHGDRNALGQLLIKLIAPGVPDLYQGTELRDGALVDPDNRRPVDLDARAHQLRALAEARPAHIVGDGALSQDLGAAKLWTIRRVLALRKRSPELAAAPYRAVAASGAHADRVFAFGRGDDLIAVVPRLGVRAQTWRDTTLALGPGPWRDVLSDAEFTDSVQPVSALWRVLPIALLSRTPR
jgi:(1->4)-alpha-D-glucan 1-alpha-D-glucosylmutase